MALLIFSERYLSEEQKASSLFESGSTVTWERAFTTSGSFLVLTKWCRCRGRIEDHPWENDKDHKVSRKIFLWENRSLYIHKKVVHFPDDSTFI